MFDFFAWKLVIYGIRIKYLICQRTNYQLSTAIFWRNAGYYRMWMPCDFCIISCDCCVIFMWTVCEFRVILFFASSLPRPEIGLHLSLLFLFFVYWHFVSPVICLQTFFSAAFGRAALFYSDYWWRPYMADYFYCTVDASLMLCFCWIVGHYCDLIQC